MAGTIPLQRLFLDRFVQVNLDRYANDPAMLPLFQNLELSEITIADLVSGTAEIQTATVTSVSRNFRGITQQWLPAYLDSPNAFVLKNKGTPLANKAALAEQTSPGIYLYLVDNQSKVGLVLSASSTEESKAADARVAFLEYYRYAIAAEEVETDASTVSITRNAYTRGVIPYVIGKEPVKIIPPTDYGRLEYPEPAA